MIRCKQIVEISMREHANNDRTRRVPQLSQDVTQATRKIPQRRNNLSDRLGSSPECHRRVDIGFSCRQMGGTTWGWKAHRRILAMRF